jgi:glycosyltransferase involved in cell wall biosynthesis
MHRRSPAPIPPDGSVVSYDEASVVRGSAPLPQDARGAVIIPAHDEAGVIARTLRALAPLTALPGIEVVVVCNGCQDETAELARGFPGVRVEETGRGSKIVALNLGDDVASAWPRLYLDADIDMDPRAVLAVFEALEEPGVLAARAYYVYDTAGASAPVRSYYRARSRTPAPPSRLWGAGGYAVTEEGHRRFARFADVTADDSWFDGQFAEAEKRVVATVPMRVRTPRDAEALLAVLTRQRRGYVELGIGSSAGTRGRGLLSSVKGPRSAIDAAWYVWFSMVSRRRAERILRQTERRWERDASSRVDGASSGGTADARGLDGHPVRG